MDNAQFCSDCIFAKIEVESNGLVLYCLNPVYKAKAGFNHFSVVRKVTARACNKIQPKEAK